jgi:IclR family acetate operon transcriptional repressor
MVSFVPVAEPWGVPAGSRRSRGRVDTRGVESPAVRGRGVLEGAFALLETLRRYADGAGVTELARACGVPKGTVHRLLDQLVAVGAVERYDGRYRGGPKLS